MESESLFAKGLFGFEYSRCLRSEYSKNECTLCIELCPEKAMVFDRGRLGLDAEACTACSACMGICPTEAFTNEAFDPDRFVLEFSKGRSSEISCKTNLPCIAALSSEHLITLALREDGDVILDLSHCKGCGVNREGEVLKSIERSAKEAERFLKILQKESRIVKRYEAPQNGPDSGRRGLFGKISKALGEIGETDSLQAPQAERKEPLMRTILKSSLKNFSQNFPEESIFEASFSFTANKRIDEKSCTNCQECAMFCPTGALSILQDNTGIIFQMGKCIGCSICNDICKPGSISDAKEFDLVGFAFDRMQILVRHRLEICEECKVAFPYRGGEKVCDRCRDFRSNHGDLFTMAKDME